MKLWDKGIKVNDKIESFTVGKDREMDLYLAPFDVLGTMAHITMLESVGLLEKEELQKLLAELTNIYKETLSGDFVIEDGIEDVHSQVEMMLTQRLGDIGKKVHSGRSRNDQVLLDLKLFIRSKIQEVVNGVVEFFEALQTQSEKYKDYLIPGYTHLQVAMPSSFGLWFGAYAESLTDDMFMLNAAWRISNQNPLGAAAGYGSSFPLNRQLTTDLLGFDNMNYNVVYAQMGRGKTERNVATALSSVAQTVGKFAMDACLYMSQNFGFLTLPGELTTGSSIMPHKKNPDVFELIRAKCNQIQSLPGTIALITGNLPSGYFRDLQLIKENFLPAFDDLISCLDLATFAVNNITIKKDILSNEIYKYAFSVEEVNKLVLQGVPFRDAYKQIGGLIEDGKFEPELDVNHTHEGTIGNLCNDAVKNKMNNLLKSFNFEKVADAIQSLSKN
ncbi:argininosuccinate lyase [Plebeiibacterium sediminum]|uniref:Argininosuccinate lyase n=1 Tax=Plebeiibacterium sediminum TaxID=2992112 RepID=A0AAE3M2L4_9BACT|nr:argininosuccinate lyase [Plebeiobacterium sediminum]MCW3786116.1 argininosuccinate lyase [Plebeiobacterium sediminum]